MLKQKLNITQDNGKITVTKSNGNFVTAFDFNRLIEAVNNKEVDAVYIANMIAEIMHDCINLDRVSCRLHDNNFRNQYSNETTFQYVGYLSSGYKVCMENLMLEILDRQPNGKMMSDDYIINGVDDADFLASYYDNADCFSVETYPDEEYIVFTDELMYEQPTLVLRVSDNKIMDYDEYCKSRSENDRDITNEV